jgi:hypothetical protein
VICYFVADYVTLEFKNGRADADMLRGVLYYFEIKHEIKYNDYGRESGQISIQGTFNVVKFWDIILPKYPSFMSFQKSIGYESHSKDEIKKKFNRWVVAEAVRTHTAEQQIYVNSVFAKVLNEAYNTLKEDPLTAGLIGTRDMVNTEAATQGHRLHPFYQLLVGCYKANASKIDTYEKLGFIDRISATKPNMELTTQLSAKYELFVLDEFVTKTNGSNGSTERSIHFKKLSEDLDKQMAAYSANKVAVLSIK